MTLTLRDFADIFSKKRALILGVALQFIVMPLAGLGVSRLLNLNDELTTSVMLVGTSAGGTASNVLAYLARLSGSRERCAVGEYDAMLDAAIHRIDADAYVAVYRAKSAGTGDRYADRPRKNHARTASRRR